MTRTLRILVVEDEYLIAQDMAHEIREMGGEVIGPVPNVDRAMDAIEAETGISAALLDINLGGESVYPIADALVARGVPVIFATGYDDDAIPARYGHLDRCQKPVTRNMLRASLDRLTSA
jgi:DNA-binding NtrC family response regulator